MKCDSSKVLIFFNNHWVFYPNCQLKVLFLVIRHDKSNMQVSYLLKQPEGRREYRKMHTIHLFYWHSTNEISDDSLGITCCFYFLDESCIQLIENLNPAPSVCPTYNTWVFALPSQRYRAVSSARPV